MLLKFPISNLQVQMRGDIEHHIPNKLNSNEIQAEFEQFYQNLVKDMLHFPDKKHV